MLSRITGVFVLVALAFAAPPAHAAFPGANGKLAFVSYRDSSGQLFTMNGDGSQQAAIPTPTVNHDPSWSADGKKLAFIGYPSSGSVNSELYVINADGGGRVRLTFDGGTKRSPTWSPDGTRIAYEGGGIQIAHVDGSGTTFLVSGSDPSWSPNGDQLVFRGDGGLWTINADGTALQRLTTDDGEHPDDEPDWSPDGQRITFKSVGCTHFCTGDDGNILVVDRDGTNRTTLTSPSNIDNDPAWSPDGTKIAFTRELGLPQFTSSREVFVMNADGTNQTRLTFNGETDPGTGWPTGPADEDPSWQPLGALDPYPRPGGATPLRVLLVPAFEQCTSPNSSHVEPLSASSCDPPVRVSDLLTTSSVGQGEGSVRLDTMVGNPATSTDEADVNLTVDISDVRNASDQSDYAGSVILSSTIRTTDRAAGFGGVSGTGTDARLDVPLSCVPTAAAPKGSDCVLATTLDALVPGMIAEGKRTILASHSFSLLDAGLDGNISAPACPPMCGTGDEERFLEQGAFTP